MTRTVRALDELGALVGEELGPSDWRSVTQDEIDAFARLSGDRQWIHVDVARARAESPWGSTIAHGDLVLAVLSGLRGQLLALEGFELVLNRGWRNVVFLGHLPADERMRSSMEVLDLARLDGDWHELVARHTAWKATDTICVAESVTWLLANGGRDLG